MNLKESFRKNKEDIQGIFLRAYPDFVLQEIDKMETNDIPVFTFHNVEPYKFERQLKYLAKNNYKTLNADTFESVLSNRIKPIENAVVLTFDDGSSSLWTTAYPLLKKYGFIGISFLIPFVIQEKNEYYPNLEDVWQGKSSLKEILEREKITPLCTWDEIKKMHNSGVIDFQSHSSSHSFVFINDKLVDFVNPYFRFSHINNELISITVNRGGTEKLLEASDLGFPIYEYESTLSTKIRYIENEKVSNACVEYVRKHGGVNFFKKHNWKKQLIKIWKSAKSTYEKEVYFQTAEERHQDIERNLSESKRIIETKLNKPVKHFCYPWYKGTKLSIEISQNVGYQSNYWGIIKNNAVNRIGDDPFYIKRINENYIFSLPGKGRKSLVEIESEKILFYLEKKLLHTVRI